MFENKSVLVTGSKGFVGQHLLRYLKGIEGIVINEIDLKDGRDIRDELLPDVDFVFHLAAQVDYFCEDATLDASINIMGSIRLMEHYKEKLVFASSSMVNYPEAPYAISKQAGEKYALMFGCKVIRFCNLFGEGGHSVVDVFKESEVMGINGKGTQVRSYSDVSNAVSALTQAFEEESPQLTVLEGEKKSVLEVADMFPDKPREFRPAKLRDLENAPQAK